MFIFSKIKLYIIAALGLLLPILYVLGRKDGKTLEKGKVIADELQAQKKAADFYKAMSEHDKTHIPTDGGELADRLRKHGL